MVCKEQLLTAVPLVLPRASPPHHAGCSGSGAVPAETLGHRGELLTPALWHNGANTACKTGSQPGPNPHPSYTRPGVQPNSHSQQSSNSIHESGRLLRAALLWFLLFSALFFLICFFFNGTVLSKAWVSPAQTPKPFQIPHQMAPTVQCSTLKNPNLDASKMLVAPRRQLLAFSCLL